MKKIIVLYLRTLLLVMLRVIEDPAAPYKKKMIAQLLQKAKRGKQWVVHSS